MSDQSDIQPAASAATTFRYEAQDFAQAQQLHMRLPRRHMIALTIFFIAAASAAVLLVEDRAAVAIGCAGGALGGIALAAAMYHWIVPYRMRRDFQRRPLAQIEHVYELRKDGLRLASERGESVLLWRDFIHWRANEKAVLLYTAPRLFLFIPTRLAASGFPIEALKAALAVNVRKLR
jgi:YcxB-like protein